MGLEPLILIANPGSASRKYALYQSGSCLARLHFERDGDAIVYSIEKDGRLSSPEEVNISHLTFAATKLAEILQAKDLPAINDVRLVALRIVAPSEYFRQDRILGDEATQKLAELEPRASLHISNIVQEIGIINSVLETPKMVGISDSAFHRSIPEYASLYAIPEKYAHEFEIKRYGYHGLSVESAVGQLRGKNMLRERVVVCHLGSGCSVTAVRDGQSIDNTMGYSPLEGMMMATRSGNLDVTAAQALQSGLKINPEKLQEFLNFGSGLLGVSGKSSDIRQLLELEQKDSREARLALKMFVYQTQQAIGRMAAALDGIDALVFTGAVGERSAEMRRRIVHGLDYLGLSLDARANHSCLNPIEMTNISKSHHPAKVYVVPADEEAVMAERALRIPE